MNRLLIAEPGQALRQARVLEGRLTTDTKNRLVYRAESTNGVDGRPGPESFVLDGDWRLTADHELALSLRQGARQGRQTLSLKGTLQAPQARMLVFALRSDEHAQGALDHRLSLSGRWGADAKNRLVFFLERADGSETPLTLQGGWEVDERQRVLYRYRQRASGRRSDERQLAFEGAWDVTAADRLTYRLAGSDNASFEFRARLSSPSLIAREGRIVYDVGIGLTQGRRQVRRVELFGSWKLYRDLSVSFEMPMAGGRVQSLRFQGTAALGPRDQVAVALSTRRRERLGLTVLFARKLLPNAELFLRLKQAPDERAVLGGVRVRF